MDTTLPLSPNERRYGYHRAPFDHRDLGLARAPLTVTLPPSVDLEPWCGPVKDQGAEGSCTAQAGCGNREYLARKFQGASPILSPQFLYYQERLIDGTTDQDSGSNGRTDCQAMNRYGICEETDDQYDPTHLKVAPDLLQLANALKWRSGAYHAVGNVDDMKSCLASGYPVLIGFAVYSSFENIGSDGIMPTPRSTDQYLGGHETLVIGFSDEKQAFKVRNSWGPTWGDKGNFWMSYDIAACGTLLWDKWIQHLGPAW